LVDGLYYGVRYLCGEFDSFREAFFRRTEPCTFYPHLAVGLVAALIWLKLVSAAGPAAQSQAQPAAESKKDQ